MELRVDASGDMCEVTQCLIGDEEVSARFQTFGTKLKVDVIVKLRWPPLGARPVLTVEENGGFQMARWVLGGPDG